MRFHYSAFEPTTNKKYEGDLEVKTSEEVVAFLARRGLRPLSVKALDITGTGRKLFARKKKVTLGDQVFLTRYLALMLRVGSDLLKAIDILIADFGKGGVHELLIEIKIGLEEGRPFHETFEKHPEYFSSVFVNLLKAGESSGTLDGVLQDLTVSLEKQDELRRKIRGAMIYPLILITLAVAILLFLVTFALPKIAEVFSGGGFDPPLFSKVVFAVGIFISHYVWVIVGLLIFFVVGGILFARTKGGRHFLQAFLRHAPLVRTIVRKLALQRFAATLSSLLKSGVPIVSSIEITSDAVGSQEIELALRRIAREGVAKGLTIGEAFRRETVFPNVITSLVAISEKAGHLDEVLKTLGTFYETEIDGAVKALISFIEPALLVGIGFIVGAIALSIIIPIYQLVGQF